MAIPKGLVYIPNIINDDDHNTLINYIMNVNRTWSKGPNDRVVQQYGYLYDYDTRSISSIKPEPIPEILTKLNEALIENKTLTTLHNQIIVNFYKPGQGISAHKDHIRYFGEEIATLSLGSTTVMDFVSDDGDKYSQILEPASIAVLSGDARWKWTHAIPARKSDKITINGITRTNIRDNRVSITFRTVVKN